MEYQINMLIQKEYYSIKRKPYTRKIICQNYDRLFSKIRSNGYTEFVAHEWTISTLSKIFGSTKVQSAMRTNFTDVIDKC